MGILRNFSRVADALERLATTHGRAVTVMAESLPSEQRLADLELSRSQFEADIEGVLLKAEGKLRAAANAEARERKMKDQREDYFDQSDQDRAELQDGIPPFDVTPVQEEEVLDMPLGLETNSKAHALRHKWHF